MKRLEGLQPKLLEELEKQAKLNASVNELACKHGASPEANGVNAVLFLKKKLDELEKLRQKALELGCSSIKSALYKLERSDRPTHDLWTGRIPQDLRRAPNHWSTHEGLVERCLQTPTGKVLALNQTRESRFANKLSPYQAQERLEKILPILGELFEAADKRFEHEARQLFFDPQTNYREFEATVMQRFQELKNPHTNEYINQNVSQTL